MTENNHVLVVDDDPKHLLLMKRGLPLKSNVVVDVASHPEGARNLILANKVPYLVIWSDFDFQNSKINGMEFFSEVSDLSPLSSRLLCSAELDKDIMSFLMKKGAIHSYAAKPISLESISSATEIGIAHHQLNLLQRTLDDANLKFDEGLVKTINYCEEINQITGSTKNGSSFLHGIEFDGRKLEREQLVVRIKTLEENFNMFNQKTNALLSQNRAQVRGHNDLSQRIIISSQARKKITQRLKDVFMEKLK